LLVLAAPADAQPPCALPKTVVSAFGANKAVWPSQIEKVIITGLFITKALIELSLVPGEIFGYIKIVHTGPLSFLRPVYQRPVSDTVTRHWRIVHNQDK
jgi:hypothetical protein